MDSGVSITLEDVERLRVESEEPHSKWWKVSDGPPLEGDRLHTCIEGRYITIFRHRGTLSAIDSICHHAGGPLTNGPIKDIEDLGVTVVLCPCTFVSLIMQRRELSFP